MRSTTRYSALPLCALALVAACDDGAHNHNEGEVITTVVLTFTPASGGAAITATFDDPDGDGGAAPTIDAITLARGVTYNATVRFENRLESPAEDITLEVADESDEHQVFYTGTAVSGPASNQASAALTHAYADTDGNGLPIGLANTFTTANASGAGTLVVTLRHLPPLNDTAVKSATTAATVRDSGFSAIGGENDANVTFQVTVP